MVTRRILLRYFGSKADLASKIIRYFPHPSTYRTLADCFGGSGSFLLNAPIADAMFYNDLDGSLTNYFRVLKDRPDEFIRRLSLTPYSFVEYEKAKADEKAGLVEDPVDMAIRVHILANQSFNGYRSGAMSGWSRSDEMRGRVAGRWTNIDHVEEVARTIISRWAIDQKNVLDFLDIYDGWDSTTLFYLDPPYIAETREAGSVGAYKNEMDTIEEHEVLLERLLKVKGFVYISHFDHPIYNKVLHGWQKRVITPHDNVFKIGKKAECVWISPNTPIQSHILGGMFEAQYG